MKGDSEPKENCIALYVLSVKRRDSDDKGFVVDSASLGRGVRNSRLAAAMFMGILR